MITKLLNTLKIFSDKTRLRIINLTYQREVCNCEVTKILGISQPAVTKHIKKLKKAGILNERRIGWWSYYSVNKKDKLLKNMLTIIMNNLEKDYFIKKDIQKLETMKCYIKRDKDERHKINCEKIIFKYSKK